MDGLLKISIPGTIVASSLPVTGSGSRNVPQDTVSKYILVTMNVTFAYPSPDVQNNKKINNVFDVF